MIEWIEAIIAGSGLLAGTFGFLYSQRRAQEKKMADAISHLQDQIDGLEKDKVSNAEMKEYVQLFTAPITQALDNVVEETRLTRQLMERFLK